MKDDDSMEDSGDNKHVVMLLEHGSLPIRSQSACTRALRVQVRRIFLHLAPPGALYRGAAWFSRSPANVDHKIAVDSVKGSVQCTHN